MNVGKQQCKVYDNFALNSFATASHCLSRRNNAYSSHASYVQ
jgi:hypothetical protein